MIEPMPLLFRLEDKFLVDDGCWEWIANKNNRGYGMVTRDYRGTQLLAHRVLYELLVGPIPEELEIDHLCRNRACVRPSHLEPVTAAENMRRARRHSHCVNGHELTDENSYWFRNGRHRQCRICRKAARRRCYERQTGQAS